MPASALPPVPVNNMRGIVAMLVAMGVFAVGDSFMKLAAAVAPTGQLVFLRGMVIFLMSLSATAVLGGFKHLWRAVSAPMALRAGGDVGSALLFQTALARVPLADLIAIGQLSPLALTAAGAVFLSEKVGWRRWTAAAAGFAGVLLIVRPGSSTFNAWALLGILSMLASTARDLATRRIDPAVPTTLIMVISSGAVALGGLALAVFETWVTLTSTAWLQVLGAGVFSMIGQLCVIIAMRSGEVATVAPFRYSILLWGILLGVVIWGELPDLLAFAGMSVVAGAGLYTFYREQHLKRLAQRGKS